MFYKTDFSQWYSNSKQNICSLFVFLAEQPGSFNYSVVNDDLEKAYVDLKDIISKVCNVVKILKRTTVKNVRESKRY